MFCSARAYTAVFVTLAIAMTSIVVMRSSDRSTALPQPFHQVHQPVRETSAPAKVASDASLGEQFSDRPAGPAAADPDLHPASITSVSLAQSSRGLAHARPEDAPLAPRAGLITPRQLAAMLRADNQDDHLAHTDLAILHSINRASASDPAFDYPHSPCIIIEPNEESIAVSAASAASAINADIAHFVSAFAQDADDADINLDGQIDPDDLMTFIAILTEGC